MKERKAITSIRRLKPATTKIASLLLTMTERRKILEKLNYYLQGKVRSFLEREGGENFNLERSIIILKGGKK